MKAETYQAAEQYRKDKLWRRLSSEQIFAVRYADGVTGYCAVLGLIGDSIGLNLYLGETGLHSLQWMFEVGDNLSVLSDVDRGGILRYQDFILCGFVNKSILDETDRYEIAMMKFKAKGKNAYPYFRRFRPRRLPWHIRDEDDEQRLYIALLAAHQVGLRLSEQGAGELGFSDGFHEGKTMPLLTVDANAQGGFAWSTQTLPKYIPDADPSPAIADELRAKRLKGKKAASRSCWMCRQVMLPTPNGDEAETEVAPVFPMALFILNRRDRMILPILVSDELEGAAEDLIDQLCELMEEEQKPYKLLAYDEETYRLLETAAGQVGVGLERIEKEDDLEMMDEEIEDLFGYLMSDGEDDDEEFDEDLFDELLNADDLDFLGKLKERTEEVLSHMSPEEANAFYAALERAKRRLPGGEGGREQPREAEDNRSYVVAVSLGKGCYRHIRISACDTLEDLHDAILQAYAFDDEHMHAFFMDNKYWSRGDAYYDRRGGDDERYTCDYRLGQLGLAVGTPFKYLFDFGDEWRFQCKVLKELNEKTEEAAVIRSVGKAPEQYPENPDDWDDEEDEAEYPDDRDDGEGPDE